MKRLKRVTGPQPFSFAPSLLFEGNDGAWSTFIIRVGTPAQTFRVLISTTGQETWVPLAEGCKEFDPLNCGELRGVQPFQNGPSNGFRPDESSTWELDRLYRLALEDNLDSYSANGSYGYDTVGLQIQNSGGPTLEHQIIAGITTKKFMLGLFQLGPKPTNFSDFNDPQPSFMWSLKNQSVIPSLSFGYAAGASYNDTLGSLVLGGYDASHLDPSKDPTPNFQFNVDLSGNLAVGLQSIQASNTLAGIVSLLPEAIMIGLDSAIPEIWLPTEACAIFERAFGLQLDNATGRYLVNDTTHTKLKELNPSIIFKLGNTTYGGPTTNIIFPYAAFDLKADYPIYLNATNYFPPRRAANDTQHVIGRTFLQEAYIVVDYERSKLSVSQRIINPNRQQTIIPIPPIDISKPSPGLGKGATIGIVVGVVLFIILLIIGGYLFYRRRKKTKADKAQDYETVEHEEVNQKPKTPDTPEPTIDVLSSHEMDSSAELRWEADGRPHAYELGPARPHEIVGRQLRAELPGT